MKISSVRHAVKEFNALREEFAEVVETLGITALLCVVRQHYMDTDRGWHFFEIGLDELLEVSSDGPGEIVLWGKMLEKRGGVDKKIKVILEPETIDSIEFEVYDA